MICEIEFVKSAVELGKGVNKLSKLDRKEMQSKGDRKAS